MVALLSTNIVTNFKTFQKFKKKKKETNKGKKFIPEVALSSCHHSIQGSTYTETWISFLGPCVPTTLLKQCSFSSLRVPSSISTSTQQDWGVDTPWIWGLSSDIDRGRSTRSDCTEQQLRSRWPGRSPEPHRCRIWLLHK